jgi:phosphoenolpyruvate-protein phosphotransferase
MRIISFRFPLPLGLHARPASLLQETCLPLAAAVRFRNLRNRRRADAKSVLALVASDTGNGDPCRLEISGADPERAALVLRDFLARVLPHADDDLASSRGTASIAALLCGAAGAAAPPLGETSESVCLPPVFHDCPGQCLQGRSLSPGLGRGPAARVGGSLSLPRRFAAGEKNAKKELRLFRSACREVAADLRRDAAAARDRNASGILRAHLAMVSDPGFQEPIARWIRGRNLAGLQGRRPLGGLPSKRRPLGGLPAGQAIGRAVARLRRDLLGSRSAVLRERTADLDDLAARLLEKLYGAAAARTPGALSRPAIGVAASLTPSQFLALDRRRLRGLALDEAGATSHTAILARSFAVPAVGGLPAALAEINAGEELIVDGRRGLVVRRPTPALKRYYRLEEHRLRRQQRELSRLKTEAARTADGVRLEIAANIGVAAELFSAWGNGAEGIGLFRTEMLFLERDAPPDENEQFAAYREAARSARGRAVIIRTLDIGGDKHPPYLALEREENPFLGRRAVRFYAREANLVRCQLRAILRAARFGALKIMVPMVSGLEEVRLVRRLLAEAAAELSARKIPQRRDIELGIMVETPAAAMFLDQLAREADFFSIGSNDLLQYFLAADRGNAGVAEIYDPRHPAFLRLLAQAAAQAKAAKRWLGLCGEMAGDPDLLPLLVGLGLDELSLAANRIPALKARLRQLDAGACRELLRQALLCAESTEVGDLLLDFNARGPATAVTATDLIALDADIRTPSEAVKELCDRLELAGRVADGSALEAAVWRREQAYPTDLGLGFAIPHGKTPCVRAASVAFLRPRRPIAWRGKDAPPVRAVLLIAVPAAGREQEHLKLIAGLSRQLMHEDFRGELLAAADPETARKVLLSCLQESGPAEKIDSPKEKSK